MIVETSRLQLRPVDNADAARLVDLDADPQVMRYVSGGQPTAPETVSGWIIPRAVADMKRDDGSGLWLVTDMRSGWFAGTLGLRAPRHSNQSELELTYRLRRHAWGRGMATEASRALLDVTFHRTTVHRIFASTLAVNTPSRRVMHKIGMQLVALHQVDDPAIDGYERGEVEYEVSRDNWQLHRQRSYRGRHSTDTDARSGHCVRISHSHTPVSTLISPPSAQGSDTPRGASA